MPRPTLKDVAARAGVSVSTVSYALNDASTLPLAEETRARVRRIAREIGYVPNGLARSLQAQASRTIGVVLGKPLTHARYAAIAQGLSLGLRDEGFHLALLDESSALAGVRDVRSRRLDGLVFVGHDDQGVPDDLLEAVLRHEVPFVGVDCAPGERAPAHPSVDFDYAHGVREMLQHLHERGVRQVLYVRPQIDSPAEAVRADAIARAKRPLTVRTISTEITAETLVRLDAGDAASEPFASRLQRRLHAALIEYDAGAATAVMCAWGTDVEACYRAASRFDDRLLVSSLAGGPLTPALWPGLSASRLPLEEGGRRAARLVVAAVHGDAVPHRVMLAPSLVTG